MIKIKKEEPDFFKKAKRKVKSPNISKAWEDENIKQIKSQLREYIISEQKFLCAYCERKLENLTNLSIDHFKKRNLFPDLTLDYNNLFVSCDSATHCERHKDSFSINKEEFKYLIHPVFNNPEYFFEYDLTGHILPKDDLSEFNKKKADFTIKAFNLNDKSLIEDRKKLIEGLIYTLEVFNKIEDYIDYGIDFYFSLLNWLLNNKRRIIENSRN
ncbi:retron system putative HNH endonuclease [Caminibacter pacificus]|uniref:TIGR02646 family protein n=1 Tax=Caminibacter pacificus TaxID=1424653 RepID=A0AAJ4RDK9_9BACT|nr:retron system putative HNH endonuclease [Caminibacter pacificus]QCI28548.1 TIGR02646 family protein [Caminibacter pacificus]ROR40725.1 uncharacterized protein (TIGR02646 family) [Caminibacter pacificus]